MQTRTASKKQAKQLPGKYQYTQLQECMVDIDTDQNATNFFAVVMDASYPYRCAGGASNRWVCTIKISDPSQPVSPEGVVETCTLVLLANKFEDLPIT